jgi:DNA-binding winged helix-turn-helix (wHTH) protein
MRDGQTVALAKRFFDLLVYLVARAGEIFNKYAPSDRAWHRIIGESRT